MKEKLRIAYFGTPDFAVEPLKRLIEQENEECGYTIVGVVTMPDKIITRRGSNQVLMSPVKDCYNPNRSRVKNSSKHLQHGKPTCRLL